MKESVREEKLKELLDQEFLDKLREVGKLYGWCGDYIEIGGFIEELHRIHGIEEDVDTIPYEIEYDDSDNELQT